MRKHPAELSSPGVFSCAEHMFQQPPNPGEEEIKEPEKQNNPDNHRLHGTDSIPKRPLPGRIQALQPPDSSFPAIRTATAIATVSNPEAKNEITIMPPSPVSIVYIAFRSISSKFFIPK